MRPKPLVCQASHTIGAKMTTAGSFVMQASAAAAAPQTIACRLPCSRYEANPQTPNTEKHTIGVSEMKARPKKIADGEMAKRNAAPRATARPQTAFARP